MNYKRLGYMVANFFVSAVVAFLWMKGLDLNWWAFAAIMLTCNICINICIQEHG